MNGPLNGKGPLPYRFEGVHTMSGSLYTKGPDGSFREWDPKHSKLAAMVRRGPRIMPVIPTSRVLYLGAANGTTSGHVADIAKNGVVYCVEVSPRSFRDLVTVCDSRENMVPILANARTPDIYARMVGKVDIVYQDIAQRDQVKIFLDNISRFLVKGGHGLLMLKSRSIDVTRDPRKVYNDVEEMLTDEPDLDLIDIIDIGMFQRDHAAFIVERS